MKSKRDLSLEAGSRTFILFRPWVNSPKEILPVLEFACGHDRRTVERENTD